MDAPRWWTASIPQFPTPPGAQLHLPPKGLRTSSNEAELLKHPPPMMQLQVAIGEARETSAGLKMHPGTMPVSRFPGFNCCPFCLRWPGERGSPVCSCTWAKAYAASLSSSCLFWAHILLSLCLADNQLSDHELSWGFNTQILDRDLPYHSHVIPSISLNPTYRSCFKTLKTLRSSHKDFLRVFFIPFIWHIRKSHP